MLSILAPIIIVGIAAVLALVIGLNGKVVWLSAVGGVILVLSGLFAVMALPARLRLEKSFTKLDLLLKTYDSAYAEFEALNQRRPMASFKEKKDFVESQLIAPLDEGLEEISLRTANKAVKSSYAPRAALFTLHRSGCEFLLLNFSLATEVEELDAKLRSRSWPETYVSNAIVSSLLPDLKQGMEKLKAALPTEDLDEATKRKMSAQSTAFAEQWGQALHVEMIALETQAVHASLMADLRRFFQLRRQSADPVSHEAGAYLSLEFASHIQQTNERWKTMREYLKGADKKDLAILQREVSNYRSIHDLLVSEDRETQINSAFESLVDGWQKKHWSQSQSLAFAEREFHSILGEKNQRADEGAQRSVAAQEPVGPRGQMENVLASGGGAEKSGNRAGEKNGEKNGEKSGEKFGHDLRMKVRTLKLARQHLVEKLMKALKNRNQDLNSELNNWAQVSRSPLKNSMIKAVSVLEQAANASPAN